MATAFMLTAAVSKWAQQLRGVDAVAEASKAFDRLQADPAASAKAVKLGSQLASICANCHRASSINTHPDTLTNLVGQNPRYLFDQMQKFAKGKRRYRFMEGMIRAMTPAEHMSVVLFFSKQKMPHSSANEANIAKDRQIFWSVLPATALTVMAMKRTHGWLDINPLTSNKL